MPYRIIGLVSLVSILILGIRPVLKRPFRLDGTVSQTWNQSGRRNLLLSWAMSFAGIGTCLGITGDIIPHYGLPTYMYGIVAIACFAMLAIAWVLLDAQPGEHGWVHGHFLGGAGLATMAVLALMTVTLTGSVPLPIRNLSGIAGVVAASWPLWYFTSLKKYFLLAEISVAGLFSVVVIWLFLA